MKDELIAIMEMIIDERMNVLGEEDQERSFRLDKAMSKIHTRLNTLLQKEALDRPRVNPTLEELKAVYENPTPMTEEEIKNTFIEDAEPIYLTGLKL